MATNPSGIESPQAYFYTVAVRPTVQSFCFRFNFAGWRYSEKVHTFLMRLFAPPLLASLYVVSLWQYRRIPACARSML
jgi:hypothetical protein